MENIFVGKITNTHGIKGELKVKSEFKYKDEIFVKNFEINIDGQHFVIESSRNHQEYKLILLEGYNNINDVLCFKGKEIYVPRDKISSSYILNEDIIGFNVIVGKKNIGKLDEVIKSNAHEILVVGRIMIPYVDAYVSKIDLEKKQIYVNDIEGLL